VRSDSSLAGEDVMKTFIATTVLLATASVLVAQYPPKDEPARRTMLTQDQIQWGAGPPALPKGAQFAVIEGDIKAKGLFTYRLKMPGGYQIKPHFHPVDEHITIISGILHMGVGDKFDTGAGTTLPAGSYVVRPAGTHHFAWSEGETIVQVHAVGPWGVTYVNPAYDPRKQ
jgi:quercetin dioxygenase-like cupin family protein